MIFYHEIDVKKWTQTNSHWSTDDRIAPIPVAYAENLIFWSIDFEIHRITNGLTLKKVSNTMRLPFAKELQRALEDEHFFFFQQNRNLSSPGGIEQQSADLRAFPSLAQILFCERIPWLRQTIMRAPHFSLQISTIMVLPSISYCFSLTPRNVYIGFGCTNWTLCHAPHI